MIYSSVGFSRFIGLSIDWGGRWLCVAGFQGLTSRALLAPPSRKVSTTNSIRLLIVTVVAMAAAPPAVYADPCELIPERGPMPAEVRRGQSFSGPVVYVGDGDSLCVGLGASRSQWAEVRLADFYAPEIHEAGGAGG